MTKTNKKNVKKSSNSDSSRVWKFIIENWPAKVICILLAVLLYMICKITTLDRAVLMVPLEVTNTGNLTYTNNLPKKIRVSVRGEAVDVSTLQEKDFKVFIDTSPYVTEGSYKVPVQLVLSETAAMIEPLEIKLSPESIQLDFDRKITDLKPVKINTSGKCAKGFQVKELKIEPELVQISGNSLQVDGMEYLETNVINLEGKKDSFTQKTKILNLNPQLAVTGNTDFTVRVEIIPIVAEKKIEVADLYYLGLTTSLAVEKTDAKYSVTISGNQNELENFTLLPRNIYLDCSDIFETGEYELPLNVILPEQFELKKLEPEKVKINVIKAPEKPAEEENPAEVENPTDTENVDGTKTESNSKNSRRNG
ncbi:MAG: hypothetical protein K6G52_04680 [Treponemataceae bacterium]|nr:hypothetical protein [Treponemataceae bacterium]